MPSYRFWAMEHQIDRIRAAEDLRQIEVNAANNTSEKRKEVVERLVKEIGETAKVRHERFVQAEPDAGKKLKALAR